MLKVRGRLCLCSGYPHAKTLAARYLGISWRPTPKSGLVSKQVVRPLIDQVSDCPRSHSPVLSAHSPHARTKCCSGLLAHNLLSTYSLTPRPSLRLSASIANPPPTLPLPQPVERRKEKSTRRVSCILFFPFPDCLLRYPFFCLSFFRRPESPSSRDTLSSTVPHLLAPASIASRLSTASRRSWLASTGSSLLGALLCAVLVIWLPTNEQTQT